MAAKVQLGERQPRPARRCERCSRRLRGRRFMDSIAMVEDGAITSLVCTDCLSLEENAQMAIMEATTELGITLDGLIMSRPKFKMAAS